MTHDPLCPNFHLEDDCTCKPRNGEHDLKCACWHCECDIIAKVRADERIKAVQECMETVNNIVWKYHLTHYHERAEVARECQRSLRAVQVMP